MQMRKPNILTNGRWVPRLKLPSRIMFVKLLALGLLVAGGIWMELRDSIPPQVDDLVLSFPEISREQNAFYSLKSADDNLTLRNADDLNPIMMYLQGLPVHEELISEIIASNTEPLRQITNGLNNKKWEWPVNENSNADVFCWIRIANLMRAEAKLLQNSGRSQEALESALRVLSLGDMMMQAARTRDHWWLGCGIRLHGLELCEDCARRKVATTSELSQISRALDELASPSESLARMAKAEYWTCLLYTSPSPRDRTRSRMPSSA